MYALPCAQTKAHMPTGETGHLLGSLVQIAVWVELKDRRKIAPLPAVVQSHRDLVANWPTATATTLEEELQAARLQPSITAAQLRYLAVGMLFYLMNGPPETLTPADVAALQVPAGELLQSPCCASPAHWKLRLARLNPTLESVRHAVHTVIQEKG